MPQVVNMALWRWIEIGTNSSEVLIECTLNAPDANG